MGKDSSLFQGEETGRDETKTVESQASRKNDSAPAMNPEEPSDREKIQEQSSNGTEIPPKIHLEKEEIVPRTHRIRMNRYRRRLARTKGRRVFPHSKDIPCRRMQIPISNTGSTKTPM